MMPRLVADAEFRKGEGPSFVFKEMWFFMLSVEKDHDYGTLLMNF